MHVRKGKLLAGDSGRKIAEVIDLQGAIYQRVAEEDRVLPCLCALVLLFARVDTFVVHTRGENERAKLKSTKTGGGTRNRRSEGGRKDEWRRI